MNLNNQIHKDLVIERHHIAQHGKKRSLFLMRSSNEMNNAELAEHSMKEIDKYRRGEPTSETYSVELLRRAIVLGELEAWNWIQQCYYEPIASWLPFHPQWKVVSKLGSSEQFVALAIKRFKQTTMLNQQNVCESIADAFRYLRICLNGVLLDKLRFYSCSNDIPT